MPSTACLRSGELRIAGAYHDSQDSGGDLLHLFGYASEPPVYYYRTIRDLENSAGPFSRLEKGGLADPGSQGSRQSSPRRLYVFWVETTTRQLRTQGRSSTFRGYRHSVRTKFSHLRLDGRWNAAQVLKITMVP